MLQSWRHFSTKGREPADKAESVLRLWWQRARNRVENADLAQSAKSAFCV
ncbi:hypothetical protein PVAP13_1NG223819 [Panicum virgatum]|uniref:Uncharacterized protein n=1 Tax=Panicum virgatum TaxID=38727 RepID=A0A8T0WN22_PANVG|nr:hypothetical protein PVAP13_1NG223819 [Panicum virgatum]